MEYKINSNDKTITILSEVVISDLLKTIYSLNEAGLINDSWIIEPNITFSYSYPILTDNCHIEHPTLNYPVTCSGKCGTLCTCKINSTLTNN